MEQLKKAKTAELQQQGRQKVDPSVVARHITKEELARHCKRKTRGTEETTRLITELITSMDGVKGRDYLGMPLLNSEKIWTIWEGQKRHVRCIQDPALVQLYTQIGTLKKAGVELKVYRCARGSTSLESYHLHLNRFIPGRTRASLICSHLIRFSLLLYISACLTSLICSNLSLSVFKSIKNILCHALPLNN